MSHNASLPPSFTLETKRCRLRHIDMDDIPHIFDATRHPGFNDGMMWDPPATIEELLVPHQRNVEAWQAGIAYCFTIETKAARDFVGRVAIRFQQHDFWSIGYWVHPREQGKGYASEAAARVVQFGFEQLALEQITATHAVWNIASRRVLEHAKMHFVEHIPQGFTKNGDWVAEDRLLITRAEWVARSDRSAGSDVGMKDVV